ncbi:hypothetical protein ACYF6T_38955 [Streptomyces sp. 7R007]
MTTTLPAPPPRIARLPRDRHGRPIPWFVDHVDGEPDFRVADTRKLHNAIVFRCCWLCGHTLRNTILGLAATQYAYVIGPMCAVNRVSSEPPAHRDCALYAAQACPFLTTPGMRRRPIDVPDLVKPDGEMILRNPGVALVWVTNAWRMIPGQQLFDVGDPAETLWFREGRPATRGEVLAAIDSGMPILRQAADKDSDPKAAQAHLDRQYHRALALLPTLTAAE